MKTKKQEETLKNEISTAEMEQDPKSWSDEQNEKIKSLEEQLSLEIEKNKISEDKYLRLYSEYTNFRNRSAKEKSQVSEDTKFATIGGLISILDDIDIAKKQIECAESSPIKEGVELIVNKLYNYFNILNIQDVELKVGDTFNPDIHECVTTTPSEDDKNKVIAIISKGYKIGNKIVKYPKVVVSI